MRTQFDITTVTPAFLSFVADHNRDPPLAELLRRDNKTELQQWLSNRQAVDVPWAFPVRTDIVEWRRVLRKLQPRSYSISSSPLSSPSEGQLTVSVVRSETHEGVARGACVRHSLLIEQAHNRFRSSCNGRRISARRSIPATPMIMVGPGTGIAPFRGFLHQRRELGCTGRNWLIFGDQRADSNFYYRDELNQMFADGFLSRLDLAFSRNQRERIYVHHRMVEHGAELWRWIGDGAHFYVCGDASRMAKDVDDALLQIFPIHSKLSEETAPALNEELVAEKRYLRDVY